MLQVNQTSSYSQTNRYQSSFSSQKTENFAPKQVDNKNSNVGSFDNLPKGVQDSLAFAELSVNIRVQKSYYESISKGDGTNVSQVYRSMSASYEVNATVKSRQTQATANANALSPNDMSPEAVAGRIVDFAMGFFDAFAKDNPDMSKEDQVKAFGEMVKGAISQGFNEALSMLGNVSQEVSDTLTKTRDLIDKKLSSALDGLLNQKNNRAA